MKNTYPTCFTFTRRIIFYRLFSLIQPGISKVQVHTLDKLLNSFFPKTRATGRRSFILNICSFLFFNTRSPHDLYITFASGTKTTERNQINAFLTDLLLFYYSRILFYYYSRTTRRFCHHVSDCERLFVSRGKRRRGNGRAMTRDVKSTWHFHISPVNPVLNQPVIV